MGDIIQFTNSKRNNEQIKQLFKNLDVELQKFIEQNQDIIDDKFMGLYDKFKIIKLKVENNSWIRNNKEDSFINYIDDVSNSEDLLSRLSLTLEYIYITDLSKGEVLKNGVKYVSAISLALCEMNKLDLKTYPSIITILQNKVLEEIILKNDDVKQRKLVIQDIIDMLIDGYNVLEIKSIYDNREKESENADTNMNSIQEIHNYYLNFAVTLGEKVLTQTVFDNLDSMLLLNNYNNLIKNKFIQIVNEVNDKQFGIIPETELVSDLVEIFLYLQDKIIEYDNEKLKKILYLKNINHDSVDDVMDMLFNRNESSLKGGM